MRIPAVNLRPQVEQTRPAWEANLAALLERSHFILGPELESFEEEFAGALGARYAIGVGSGAAAIELSLREAGITGEVITSALTAPFTAVAIRAAGAKPVFADIDPETLQISADDVARRISKKTKAIVPVHLYGQPCAIGRIAKLGVPVIQDACQAHGATLAGKKLTEFSNYVTYSFYPTKNLGALGDGGAILTNRPAIAKRLKSLRDGGRKPGTQVAALPNGINSRLDDLHCCFLRAFLPHLGEWNCARAGLAAAYDRALEGISGVQLVKRSVDSVCHLYVIRARKRDALRKFLAGKGIGTGVHYPVALHQHPAFPQRGRLAAAEQAVSEIVSLPLYPSLTLAEVDEVAGRIREYYR